MIFVLLVVISSEPNVILTQEFSSQERCIKAGEEFEKLTDAIIKKSWLSFKCVEK
jgi:hypothetical protein